MDKEEYKLFPPMEPGECNEVKVGDKIIVYDKYFGMNRELEVTEVAKVYDPFTFEPVVAVLVKWDITNIHGKTYSEAMKLSIPDPRNTYVYFNSETKEEIKQLTFKEN